MALVKPPNWLNTLVICVTIGALTALVICGLMIVKEYHKGKAFVPAECVTTGSLHVGESKCTFSNGKRRHSSYYPCVQLLVYYKTDTTYAQPGVLFESAVQAEKGLVSQVFTNYGTLLQISTLKFRSD